MPVKITNRDPWVAEVNTLTRTEIHCSGLAIGNKILTVGIIRVLQDILLKYYKIKSSSRIVGTKNVYFVLQNFAICLYCCGKRNIIPALNTSFKYFTVFIEHSRVSISLILILSKFTDLSSHLM